MQCLKGLNEDKKLKIDGQEVSVKDFIAVSYTHLSIVLREWSRNLDK